MIKVYVFITGLALYQFSSTAGGPTTVIFPSGDYDYPGLAHIPAHSLTALAGDYDPVLNLPSPLESTLTVACPGGGCSAIQVPVNIPQLADLLDGPVVKSECATLGTGADCHPRDLRMAKGRNGVLQLSGNWSAEALTDCGGGYPQVLGPFVDLNYVRAARSWDLMFDDSDLFKPTANSVLFLISIGSMDELTVSNTDLKAALNRPTSTAICNTLPHFQGSGASGCAVVLIRSGQDHDTYVGGADLHFAALYSLLENQLDPAELWLPTALKWRVCDPESHGGAGNGMSHCTGASVVVP